MDNVVAVQEPKSKQDSEYHVASFVAHAIPEQLEQVRADILHQDGAEIHAINELGKIVFTIEASSQKNIAIAIDQLKTHTGLYNLAPVYHQFLTEN